MPYSSTTRSMLDAGLRRAREGLTKAHNAAVEAGDEGVAADVQSMSLTVQALLEASLNQRKPRSAPLPKA